MKTTRYHRSGLVSMLSVLTLVLLSLVGCSKSSSDPSQRYYDLIDSNGEKLTEDQALRFSQTLFNNTQKQGAHFVLTGGWLDPKLGQTQIRAEGDIEWKDGAGFSKATVEVSTKGEKAYSFDILVAKDAILFRIPDDAKRPDGFDASAKYLYRPLHPEVAHLDRLLILLPSLAAVSADNPVLLGQGDARYLGSEKVAGIDTEIYRYSQSNAYWVAEDFSLMRFASRLGGYNKTAVIELTDWADKPVGAQIPAPQEAVDAVGMSVSFLGELTGAKTVGFPENSTARYPISASSTPSSNLTTPTTTAVAGP